MSACETLGLHHASPSFTQSILVKLGEPLWRHEVSHGEIVIQALTCLWNLWRLFSYLFSLSPLMKGQGGCFIRMAKTPSQKIKSRRRNKKTPSRFFSKFIINFPPTLLQILKIFLQLLARETISLSKDLCVLLHLHCYVTNVYSQGLDPQTFGERCRPVSLKDHWSVVACKGFDTYDNGRQ